MGIEQSTLIHESSNIGSIGGSISSVSSSSITTIKPKPNKIKRYNHFHSKPSHLVDLIVNKDWQKLLISLSSPSNNHQKEVFMTHKVRLYGVDRKVLPLHLACAMNPPLEVIEGLLKIDKNLNTVKTPMKSYKKKMLSLSKGSSGSNSSNSGSGTIMHKSVSSSSLVQLPDAQCMTPTTEPLSSFDASDIGHDDLQLQHSLSSDSMNTDVEDKNSTNNNNNFFFAEGNHNNKHRNEYFALQLTPTGEVKQISPNGKCCQSINDTDSPFVYASNTTDFILSPGEDKKRGKSNLAEGFLPLHIACLFKASSQVIQLLIQSYPQALRAKNNWGMLPIHIVCANISLEAPKIASKKAVDEFTARRYLNNLYADTISDNHIIVWEKDKIVEILIDGFPDSLNITSDNVEWSTPIEYVEKRFEKGHERECLLALLKNKRQSVTMTNHDFNEGLGGLYNNEKIKFDVSRERPLLYSYLKMKDWENVHNRAKLEPEEASCWVTDKDYDNGFPHLPIHLACSQAAPRDVIQALIEANREGLMSKGNHGFIPLHIACKMSLDDSIIHDLIQSCPETVSQKDEYGRIPLHLACKNKLSYSVVNALIEVYPESCIVKDYNGHTAITYFYIHNESCDDEISQLFAKYDGSFIKK